jgi:predicted nucleotidyltransferase
VDLRGAHVQPTRDLLGLDPIDETVDRTEFIEGVEIDLVTHEAGKFFRLLLRPNGYVLEQLMSPLDELRSLVPGLITRNHVHHYRGFANTEWGLFLKGDPKRVKPLLYVYRVLLTGTHLMRSGEVVADLPVLAQESRLDFIGDLIELKRSGKERVSLASIDVPFHQRMFDELMAGMMESAEVSSLPAVPSVRDALSDLLVRIRLANL